MSGPGDPGLRSVDEVVARARCVQALLIRQQIEDALAREGADKATWAPALARLAGYLQADEVAGALTDDEATMVAAPTGAWPQALITDAAWRIEGLAVLLWTLGKLRALPGLDAPIDPETVHAAAPLWPTVADLQPQSPWPASAEDGADREADLDGLARAAGIYRWRARLELAHRAARRAGAARYAEVVERGAARAAEAGLVAVEGGDLAAFGKRFGALSTHAVREIGSVAIERERAAAWLLGRTDWDAPRAL